MPYPAGSPFPLNRPLSQAHSVPLLLPQTHCFSELHVTAMGARTGKTKPACRHPKNHSISIHESSPACSSWTWLEALPALPQPQENQLFCVALQWKLSNPTLYLAEKISISRPRMRGTNQQSGRLFISRKRCMRWDGLRMDLNISTFTGDFFFKCTTNFLLKALYSNKNQLQQRLGKANSWQNRFG